MSEIALLGKKIGMTREFYKSGQLVPVTVLKMEKARVIQVIDKEKRGYTAVQLGYGKIKNSKLTKAMKGYFSKRNTEAKRKLKEYRVQNIESYKEAINLGYKILKIFPASKLGINFIKKLRTDKQKDIFLIGAGGIKSKNINKLLSCGYDALVIGRELKDQIPDKELTQWLKDY